tara:strand:- start:66 stop:2312 length:2247 start_codon:yes stop_codon:yes gene_type:complete
MNTPKDISTLIHTTIALGGIAILASIIIPLINNRKNPDFIDYKNKMNTSASNTYNSAKEGFKSKAKTFIASVMSMWKKNKIKMLIGGGVGGVAGILFTVLNAFGITNILNHKLGEGWDGLINFLLLGIIGFFSGPTLRAGFNPNGPYLWYSILLLFFVLLFTIITFYSNELNIFLNPSTYQANITFNRIFTWIFAILVFAAVIIGVFIWSKNPSNHARGTSTMPTVKSDGTPATFTSQTGWLLSEMKNYLFILCGVGLISAILFAIILFSTTNVGARYVPHIIMFVCGTILGAVLYLYLRTAGKPILDKLSKFPIFKLLYHILFLIPCFFLDIVNSIYTELKGTPKIAYTLFTIEMIVIILFISGPLITSHLYKHHPNTNIDIMKQTLETEKNAVEQDILAKRQQIKEIKRYGLFKKNWLTTGSKFWDKLLHKEWYKIEGQSNVTRIPDVVNGNNQVACNPKFVNFFRINFAGPPGDNSDLLKHWKYVSEDDKSGGEKMGAALRIIRLQQEIKDLEQRLIQIEKEKLSNDGFAMTKVLRMSPIKTNHKQLISTYKDIYTNESMPSPLYKKGNFDYALSVWTFFHSISPESTIDKYYRIVSYGNKPGIYFNPIKRKIAITLGIESEATQNTDTKKWEINNLNGEKQIILGVIKNIKLQRWNNLVINCNNGVLDIFINGKLNASYNLDFRKNPFLGNDSVIVGETNGLDSGICNIVFFSTHISKIKIQTLYESLKDKDPPVVFDLDTFFK